MPLYSVPRKHKGDKPLSDNDVDWDDNLPPVEICPYSDQGGGTAQSRYNKLKQELKTFKGKTDNGPRCLR